MLTEAIRLIITLALAVSSAFLAKKIPLPYVPKNIALILYIIIGTGLGYVLGGISGRRIAKLVKWVENKTKKISSYELLAGVGGLILGLIIASLISKPVESALKPLGFSASYAITLIYFILGYMGFTLFVQRQFNFDLVSNAVSTPSLNKGENILDTSVIIDGRIIDILNTGFIQGVIIIPKFVLAELQTIADSGDELRRAKGRRGLEVLQQLQKQSEVTLQIIEDNFPSLTEVDDKLVRLCKERSANLVTNDFNLAKVAAIEGIRTLNLNDLTSALKPVFLPGEKFSLAIIKPGKEKNQGVGYLDDGTMVVVENGRRNVGKTVEVTVNSILQTSAGKLIFTKYEK